MTIQQAYDLGVQHHQTGRLHEAEQLYRQILAQRPDHADALHLLGVIANQVGRNDIAIDLIGQAIALRPGESSFHFNSGNALCDLGRLDEAVVAYRRALGLRPDFAEAYNNLGEALRIKGNVDEAFACYERAIVLRPDYVDAHYNLGNVLKNQGQLDQAVLCYRRALEIKPDYAAALNNLANALFKQGRIKEAIVCYKLFLELRPEAAGAYRNLGNAWVAEGQLDEAIACYERNLTLEPDCPEACSNMGNALSLEGRVDEAIACYRRALRVRPGYSEADSNLLFALHYHSDLDAAAVAEEHRRWNRQHAEPLRQFIRAHSNDCTPDRKLRIGYISPDFREHPVARFLLPLLEHHDRSHFEIFMYAQVPAPDAMTGQLRSHADGGRSIVGLSDERVVELIRADRIDVLVDLAGHTDGNRLLVFARKPAPVQVTFLGYPDTTGLETMDYRLTDAFADPEGQTEPLHSERLIRLSPCAWCYRPTHGPAIPERSDGPITFGCFNTFAKVTEPMLRRWSRILRAVPDSRLLLKALGLGSESVRQHVWRLLDEEGIAAARVDLRGPEPSYSGHLSLYERMDIALDTFPYHGTNTTCEALWMGVPVVSLAGKTHVSRVGVSLLSNVGLPELVAQSEEEYVRIAVELATDRARLKELRSTLRQRMERSPLMNASRYARTIESAYRQMWHTMQRG